MADDVRQSSGSTSMSSSNVSVSTGTGTTQSAEVMCGCPQPGPETIQVEQVLGAEMAQRVVEADMVVPSQKPDIEQVIDVYVKDVQINSVDVLTNKVIIRGDLGVKVMYVADLPDQPVHAFEKSQIRFTRDIEIEGATRDMKAKADVTVEYIDYDFDESNNRQIHITIVLKFWARVVTTTDMDIYALGPVDEIGQTESTTANSSTGGTVSASQSSGETISASHFAGYSEDNTQVTGQVTGPGIAPTTGPQTNTGGMATVTGTNVNIRTGPGTTFPVVTKVNKGDGLTIKDQAFGWYKVVLPDGTTTGWVASWLVDTGVPGTPKG